MSDGAPQLEFASTRDLIRELASRFDEIVMIGRANVTTECNQVMFIQRGCPLRLAMLVKLADEGLSERVARGYVSLTDPDQWEQMASDGDDDG